MSGILDLFRRVERNRYLYIGDAGFNALWHLKTGYQVCLSDNAIQTSDEYERFEGFVRNSLNEEEGPLSIWTLIANHTTTDGEAFSLFFSLLNEFDANH